MLSTAEDDAYDVYEEVFTMAERWGRIAVGLKLPPRMKSLIAIKHPNNPEDCLLAVVDEWLKGLHNVQKYGHPSWRTLVQAVADPMGGANPALAHSIAAKHPGNHHPHVTECSVVSHILVSLVTSAPGGESDANRTVQTAHLSCSEKIAYMYMHTTSPLCNFSLCICCLQHSLCDSAFRHLCGMSFVPFQSTYNLKFML